MKIVLDTNVWIAALISRGLCFELLEHCFLHHTLVTSQFILDELSEKLIEKFGQRPEAVAETISLLVSRTTLIAPPPLIAPVSQDAEDDNVLAAAIAADCDLIITGDKDLLDLVAYMTVRICTPRQFLESELGDQS